MDDDFIDQLNSNCPPGETSITVDVTQWNDDLARELAAAARESGLLIDSRRGTTIGPSPLTREQQARLNTCDGSTGQERTRPMTEQEWQTTSDPASMLRHVEGRVSERKLRLWCAALYSSSQFDYGFDASWEETGMPDAGPEPEEHMWCNPLYDNKGDPPMELRADLLRVVVGNPWRPVTRYEKCNCRAVHGKTGTWVYESCGPDSRWVKCPDCPGTGMRDGLSALLLWNDAVIPRLARDIYDRRDWPSMRTVLADALCEAGCEVEEIVRWCRGEERCPDEDCRQGRGYSGHHCDTCHGTGWIPRRGPSVRGDFVIDILTGRS